MKRRTASRLQNRFAHTHIPPFRFVSVAVQHTISSTS